MRHEFACAVFAGVPCASGLEGPSYGRVGVPSRAFARMVALALARGIVRVLGRSNKRASKLNPGTRSNILADA
eukprot:1676276-Alexandrium_andersonii.AAC.1